MRHFTLTAINDPHSGQLGLKIEGVPEIDYPMAASEGLLIAHDLLEHQQGLSKIGTIGDELLACGGIWYVRGQHADIRRDGIGSALSTEDQMSGDVVNMGQMYVTNEQQMLHIRPPARKPACEADESIDDIIACSRYGLKSELECSFPDGETYDIARREKYLKLAGWLMRRGYNMARRRFERCERSRYYANNMFWNIAEAVDPWCKHAEYEGQRFRLSYGVNEAVCKELYDEEDY